MGSHRGILPHRVFAENLFRLCNAHGSIASVCRGIGINRQQFNKYLSGSALPNPATLSRICDFLNVDPNAMFRQNVSAKPVRLRPFSATDFTPPSPSTALLAGMEHAIRPLNSRGLRDGCYFLYYPWMRDPRRCVRAAVVVHHHEGQAFFSRFTKFKILGQRTSFYLRGRHDGVALSSTSSLYMLATNSRGHGDISLIAFALAENAGQNTMNGLALVTAASPAPLALRVLMEYRGPASLHRETMRAAGILPLADHSVPAYVRKSIGNMRDAHAAVPILKPYQLVDDLSAHTAETAQST